LSQTLSDAPTILGADLDADHIIVCPVCAQAFDRRDLGQTLHHFPDVHVPLEDDEA